MWAVRFVAKWIDRSTEHAAMIRCPFCKYGNTYRIHRQWYARWFGVLSDRRRYWCSTCERRFWSSASSEISVPPPLRDTFIRAVPSTPLDTDQKTANTPG